MDRSSVACAPEAYFPDPKLVDACRKIAAETAKQRHCAVAVSIIESRYHEIIPAYYAIKFTVGQRLSDIFNGISDDGNIHMLCMILMVLISHKNIGKKKSHQIKILSFSLSAVRQTTSPSLRFPMNSRRMELSGTALGSANTDASDDSLFTRCAAI